MKHISYKIQTGKACTLTFAKKVGKRDSDPDKAGGTKVVGFRKIEKGDRELNLGLGAANSD